MPKWKNAKIRQEPLEQVEKELQQGQKAEKLPSLSEFVADAIRCRVETKERKKSEYVNTSNEKNKS